MKRKVYEIVEDVIATVISMKVAEKLEQPHYCLYIIDKFDAGVEDYIDLVAETLPNLEVIRLYGTDFDEDYHITGLPMRSEEGLVKRAKSYVTDRVLKAHEEGKDVILHVDRAHLIPAFKYRAFLNLIHTREMKEYLGIEKPIVLIFSGYPQERGYWYRFPSSILARMYVAVVEDLGFDIFENGSMSKDDVVRWLKKINLDRAIEDILSRTDEDIKHPFVRALIDVHEEQLKQIAGLDNTEGIEGIPKGFHVRSLQYASEMLFALETIKGELTRKDIERTFYGFMGNEVAFLAANLYDSLRESGLYDHMDRLNTGVETSGDALHAVMEEMKERLRKSFSLFLNNVLAYNKIQDTYDVLMEVVNRRLELVRNRRKPDKRYLASNIYNLEKFGISFIEYAEELVAKRFVIVIVVDTSNSMLSREDIESLLNTMKKSLAYYVYTREKMRYYKEDVDFAIVLIEADEEVRRETIYRNFIDFIKDLKHYAEGSKSFEGGGVANFRAALEKIASYKFKVDMVMYFTRGETENVNGLQDAIDRIYKKHHIPTIFVLTKDGTHKNLAGLKNIVITRLK